MSEPTPPAPTAASTILRPETLVLYEYVKAEMVKRYGDSVQSVPDENGFYIEWTSKRDATHAHIKVFTTKGTGVMRIEFTDNLRGDIWKMAEMKYITKAESDEGVHPTYIHIEIKDVPSILMMRDVGTNIIYGKIAVREVERFSFEDCKLYAMGILDRVLMG